MILTICISLSVGLFCAIFGRGIYEKYKVRIHFRRINNSNSKYLEGFFELNKKLLPEEEREDEEEIRRYIEEYITIKPKIVEEIVLVAIKEEKVVGYISATICLKRKYGLINYMGVDNENVVTKKHISQRLVSRLNRTIRFRRIKCKAFLYECDSPYDAKEKKEKNKRWSRLVNFKNIIRKNYYTYILPIEYKQPLLTIEEINKKKEIKMVLAFVPLNNRKIKSLSRSQLEEILQCVYFEWYDYIFRFNKNYELWKKYINNLYENVKKNISEKNKLMIQKGRELIST
jgi:hypothetical protein